MSDSEPAHALMLAHSRLRAAGFGVVSVLTARSALDGRVWLGQWRRLDNRGLVIAPSADPEAALAAYGAHVGGLTTFDGVDPGRLPFILLPGKPREALDGATALVGKHPALPVAITCGIAEVVATLLDPSTPARIVAKALEGLAPTEDTERQVLASIAEGRKLQPFFRGPCEGLVYYMLQARAETRGLFEPNGRVANRAGGRKHEVDLICAGAKLVIEIDGPEHQQPRRRSMDAQKQADLEAQGYRVRRFDNDQVVADPVGVWRLIHEQMTARIDARENT